VESIINRYYDPTTDQFLSVDPAVAQTNQPFVFANDNPLNVSDPLGLSWWNPVSWSTNTWENIATVSAVVAVLPIPGLDVVAGTIAIGAGSIAASRNVKNHNYTAAALDVVGVGLSAFAVGTALQSAHALQSASLAAKDSAYLSPMLKSIAAEKATVSVRFTKSAGMIAITSFGLSNLKTRSSTSKTTCVKGTIRCR
jgi:hypothetical protein